METKQDISVYEVAITRRTRKGIPEVLHKFIVKSYSGIADLQRAYTKSYKGFVVEIKEILEIEIVVGEGVEKDSVREIESSSVKYQPCTEYSSEAYRATIAKRDIPEWDKWVKDISVAQKRLQELEEEFKKNVQNKFGLKSVYNFKRNYEDVRFEFLPSQFSFNTSSNDTK